MKQKCLFIEGNIQVGKSTAILKQLKLKVPMGWTGGFMCQRLVNENKTKAFCLTPIENVKNSVIEYHSDIPNIFLEDNSGNWQRNDDVFNSKGLEILANVNSKKLVVMDEIGGVELLVEPFRERIYEILSGDVPVLGVIKSNNNKSIMKKSVNIEDSYHNLYKKLHLDIRNHFNGIILHIDKSNILHIENEISNYLNEIIK